jgi:hypothetical protein
MGEAAYDCRARRRGVGLGGNRHALACKPNHRGAQDRRRARRRDFREPGSIALWDNRCAQHNPVNDYHGYRRLMHRITLKGEKPK